MTLVAQAELLRAAREGGYAVGSFNVVDSESVLGVLEAAEQLRSPVIVALYAAHEEHIDAEALAASIVTCARRATVPVGFHYDHATSIAAIARALRYGCTSVMYDGYGAPWEVKLAETRTVVEMAHGLGALVEAALSAESHERTGNPQDGSWKLPSGEMAAEFVAATGVDTIAVGEGSSELDPAVLAGIASSSGAFASLHGGSQLPDEAVAAIVAAGIAKCSVYSKLAKGAMRNVKHYVESGGDDLMGVLAATRSGYVAAVGREIERFGSAGRA